AAGPDERTGGALGWVQHSLDSLVVEAPGVGRSIVVGYDVGGSDAGAPASQDRDAGALVVRGHASPAPAFRTADALVAPRFITSASVAAALAALAVGAFDAARDVLTFLGEHLDESGRAPDLVSLTGEARYDDPDATALYLILAARYLAWTSDIGFVRDTWARVRATCEHVREAREASERARDASVSKTGLTPI